MTGGAFQARAKQFLSSVANPVLEKPFETTALHPAIAQVIDANTTSGTWLTAKLDEAM